MGNASHDRGAGEVARRRAGRHGAAWAWPVARATRLTAALAVLIAAAVSGAPERAQAQDCRFAESIGVGDTLCVCRSGSRWRIVALEVCRGLPRGEPRAAPRRELEPGRATPPERATPPGRAAISATQRTEMAKIQWALNAAGCDAGTVDGLSGPRTLEALACLQRQAGVDPGDGLSTEARAGLIELYDRLAERDGLGGGTPIYVPYATHPAPPSPDVFIAVMAGAGVETALQDQAEPREDAEAESDAETAPVESAGAGDRDGRISLPALTPKEPATARETDPEGGAIVFSDVSAFCRSQSSFYKDGLAPLCMISDLLGAQAEIRVAASEAASATERCARSLAPLASLANALPRATPDALAARAAERLDVAEDSRERYVASMRRCAGLGYSTGQDDAMALGAELALLGLGAPGARETIGWRLAHGVGLPRAENAAALWLRSAAARYAEGGEPLAPIDRADAPASLRAAADTIVASGADALLARPPKD